MKDVKIYRDLTQKITDHPIIYKWWFRQDIIITLLDKVISEIDISKILVKNGYALLYIGSGINGHNRLIKYHILDADNYHIKGVYNRRLSSLRQTLCGLLDCNMSSGFEFINDFIDKYCKIEWRIVNVKTKKDLELIEKKEIIDNYLPLNWKNTKGILTIQHRRILTLSKNAVRR